MEKAKTKQEFNLTIAPLWAKESGNLFGMKIEADHYDALQQVEVGGVFAVKFLKEKSRKSDKSPNAYLEYITPAKWEEYKAKYAKSSTSDDI